ncbi:hypothetical protein FA95DRAFT_662075 [Auriscalpium vulgare]|uniref:Uncharacterized protein n=1 Tax=Auriscalpium vulgare TaxID=40419 RepID=A0ACB8S286_9AGAM|nr:hypothetical protein FA95DRAFT_662075 [Auriscalpium vulgare]
MSSSKVSFTIRRPTPDSRSTSTGAESDDARFKVPALPRHITNDSTPGSPLARSAPASPKPRARTYDEVDSSDEDVASEDELVTGFDQFGVQRVKAKPKPQGPLVIPALQNRDWREMARKRRAAAGLYVPPGAAATTGADGSVGGLGTKDTINSGPQVEGLQMRKRVKLEEGSEPATPAPAEPEPAKAEEETEDQRAIRALLAGTNGQEPTIDAIPVRPTEDDAFKQDVDVLPREASLADYERVPVAQFGAALLRGMGWTEGAAASRTRKGLVEPWLPAARPALLGIGAREREVLDDGSGKGKKQTRPERRYVPVLRRESGEGSREGSGSRGGSRRASPEPGKRDRDERNGRERDTERYRERDRERDRDRDRDRDRRRDEHDRRGSGRGHGVR